MAVSGIIGTNYMDPPVTGRDIPVLTSSNLNLASNNRTSGSTVFKMEFKTERHNNFIDPVAYLLTFLKTW
jgi:hypothetical protein